MGCGSSSPGAVVPVTDRADDRNNNTGPTDTKTKPSNGHVATHPDPHTQQKPPKSPHTEKNGTQGHRTEKHIETKPPAGPVPKPISFEIGVNNNINIDSIISKHPPKRLKRLEPLDNAPVLTPEMVEEKLRQAEEKRKKQLEEKVQVSRRSSRLRRDLLQAREFEKTQQQSHEIDEKLRSADKNREAKQRELEERKKQRDEKARLVREKAKKLKQGEDGLDYDLEKDEAFNADDDDSWLGGDDRPMRMQQREDSTFSMGERIYSGRESPHKNVHARSSAEQRARMSAGTTDSFDYAFQRDPHNHKNVRDDFFDS